jgi:hypothetical protein
MKPVSYIVEYRGYVFRINSYLINLLAFLLTSLVRYSTKKTIKFIKKKFTLKSNHDNIPSPRDGSMSMERCLEPDQIYEAIKGHNL